MTTSTHCLVLGTFCADLHNGLDRCRHQDTPAWRAVETSIALDTERRARLDQLQCPCHPDPMDFTTVCRRDCRAHRAYNQAAAAIDAEYRPRFAALRADLPVSVEW